MSSRIVTTLLAAIICTACDYGPTAPRGFSLPDGDIDKGKQVFLEMQCLSCHTLSGYAQENQGESIKKEREFSIALGGEVKRIKTYAELLTSIINPSHKFPLSYSSDVTQSGGLSRMKNYNEVMTVAQLIDLVTFLQPHYQLRPYTPSYYMDYH